MPPKTSKRDRVVIAGAIFAGCGVAHLIDDFLYGIPAEFGLTVRFTQVLAGIFHLQLVLIFVLTAQDRRLGYGGLLFWGLFLTLAGFLKHIPEIVKPEPYWSGWFSEMLILGLMVSGMATALSATLALRDSRLD